MLDEFIKLSIGTLRKRKLRSWLTMLGIFIGIAAIVAIISLGQGLKISVEEEFAKLGTDKLLIQPRGGFGPPGSDLSTTFLTEDDREVIESVLGVDQAAGILSGSVKIKANNQVRYTYLAGISTDQTFDLIKEFMYFEIDEGRELKSGDKKKAVLGSRIAKGDLFKPNLKIRDRIELNGESFKVVGIYEAIGSSEDDSSIFISEDGYRELFDEKEKWDIIIAKASQDPDVVSARIEKKLRKHRNVEEGKEDFAVSTTAEFLDAVTNVLGILNVFLVGIAGISLIVGGIGIMNTMYTSVLERTQEIGVMKAIGAKNRDVLAIFLIESGVLGFLGGLIGVIIGVTVAKLAELIIAQTGNSIIKAALPWWLIIGALLFSFLVGAISGVAPAYRASKLKPTEALRYE